MLRNPFLENEAEEASEDESSKMTLCQPEDYLRHNPYEDDDERFFFENY